MKQLFTDAIDIACSALAARIAVRTVLHFVPSLGPVIQGLCLTGLVAMAIGFLVWSTARIQETKPAKALD